MISDQLVWLSHDLIDRGGVAPPTAEIWSLSGHSCGHRAVKGAGGGGMRNYDNYGIVILVIIVRQGMCIMA